ncbi:hypothetical protein [Streptomyces sp. NEAU-NA10]|uniref:hypothetical protein n=1 Tax=Streptomyces sp. NEAU-NA10 TaxID=3416050 RepID=UPI003CC5FA47
MSEPQTEDTMIAALLREREGLVQLGKKDRVAQVDEQLKLRGYKPRRTQDKPQTPAPPAPTPTPAEAQKVEEQQRTEPPKGRQPQGKSAT